MPFRSLSLWLGLFGLVFLLWAWADSFERTSGIHFQRGRPYISAANDNSTLRLSWGVNIPRNHAGITREISTDPERPLLWARPRLENFSFGPTNITSLRIPHWLLLCLYLPAWVILLAWRLRKRAAAKEHAPGETPPSPPRRSPRKALRNLRRSSRRLLAPLAGFRFHRLLSFWAGLFGLSFLTWAALDSGRTMSTWSHHRHGVHWQVIHSSGTLYIGRSLWEEKTPSAWGVTMPPADLPPGFARSSATRYLGDRLAWGRDLAEVAHPFGGNTFTRDTRHLALPYRDLILLYCAA